MMIKEKQDRPRRIVVFRALHLGDLLCAVPAWRALRHAFPEAHIALLGLPWAQEFAERFNGYFDEFIAFPGYPGLPELECAPRRILPFLRLMQEKQFDLALQMHGNGTITNPLVALFGASRISGFYMPHGYCPDPAYFLPYPINEPEIRRHLLLMEKLGVPLQGHELEFPIAEQEEQEARRITGAALEPLRYACIHPGARSLDRRWPVERFAAVADAMSGEGLQVVLTGTRREADLCGQVSRLMKDRSINLAGRTSLGTLAAIVKHARLLVSNDTGVSHVAAALRTPSVIVAGFDTPRWAPLDGALHRVVYNPRLPDGMLNPESNEIHSRHERDRRPLMMHITVDSVMNQVDDLMRRTRGFDPSLTMEKAQ